MRSSIVGMNVVNVIRARSMASRGAWGSKRGWITIVWPRYSQARVRTMPPVVKNGVVASMTSARWASVDDGGVEGPGQHAAVVVDDALGAPGGAARVEQTREVVGRERRRRRVEGPALRQGPRSPCRATYRRSRARPRSPRRGPGDRPPGRRARSRPGARSRRDVLDLAGASRMLTGTSTRPALARP